MSEIKRRKVVILGSTGSIGTSALKVARQMPERMEVVGLAAGTRVEELAAQADVLWHRVHRLLSIGKHCCVVNLSV